MLQLYLIRHAESLANTTPEICSGQSNHVPLSERGIRQAQALQVRLQREGLRFDRILRSTAVRTAMTAQYALGDQPAYAQITAHDELLEVHQGDFEGKPKKEVYNAATLAQIKNDPWNFRPPQGESQHDVALRMWKCTHDIVAQYHAQGNKPTKVAFVTHGLAIRVWMREILPFDPRITWMVGTENTSITQFNYINIDGDYLWVPERINDAAHIAGIT